MSVLNKMVSYYPAITQPNAGTAVDLLMLLKSNKHEAIIQTLRAEENPAKQKELKGKLPCYTVAGVFKHRNETGLITPSGLAAIDLDSAEDYDTTLLIQELKKILYIAYCGLSCRGKRLFAIVPLMYPDKYVRQYERLIQSFNAIGLPMGDECRKKVSQPRFISYNTDATCFYNHSAKKYNLLTAEQHYSYSTTNPCRAYTNSNSIKVNPFEWCVKYVNKNHSFAQGSRHDYIVHLARYCNIKGLPKQDTLNGCLKYVSGDFNSAEIISIVNHIYNRHINSHNLLPFTY